MARVAIQGLSIGQGIPEESLLLKVARTRSIVASRRNRLAAFSEEVVCGKTRHLD